MKCKSFLFVLFLPCIKSFEWPTLTYKPQRLCTVNETYDPSMLLCEICNGPNTVPSKTGNTNTEQSDTEHNNTEQCNTEQSNTEQRDFEH